jgi:hypothetical protein
VTGVKGIVFPLLAGLCWAAFLYRVRDLRMRQRDPALLALLVAFAMKGTEFLLATPRIAAAVDERTGIPNLGALGIHLFGGVAFGAAVLVALVYWVSNPAEAWPRVRWRLAVAALVMMTMFSLWVAAEVGTEQRSPHYLVQNAHRPLVAIYGFLYVVTLLVALGEITRMCLKYSPLAGRRWLRHGLRTTAIGALIYSVTVWSRAFSIVAVHLSLNPLQWEVLTPFATGIGIPLMIAGLTMPCWGPHMSDLRRWWDNCHTYRRLYPLWRDLYQASPGIALHPPTRSMTHLNYRLYRRVIEIRDGLLALRSYRDPEVRIRARRCGEAAGLTGDELRAAVAAAQLRAALNAKAQGRVALASSRGSADDREIFELRRGNDLTTEAAWLRQIARAYTRSPVA